MTRQSFGRKPRTPKKETFADLAAALAERLCAADRTRPTGQMFSFPPAAEWDEFGFNTRTGEAGFEAEDDPIKIALPPGRPRKSR